ncbi:uncharacterized protein LOC111364292 [Spodoptera litura]|uniref:Uncharacterized protein LOC111357923 n=1 Tax=Spodoptera litura TaxID=69820 RepID=A0A9J7EDT0_SPOLT|nr:uncharacterized protein LOC111357923 [Spodoptera litura]XP_022836911.1 uncharacterized protein LOC111364292 [Spodoptera litura]
MDNQGQEDSKNVNMRKNIRKKNPDEQQMADLKQDLLIQFKKMMMEEIAVIKEQNTKILESNAEIKTQLELIDTNYKKICNRLQRIETKYEAAVDRIGQLEIQLNTLQKQTLKNTIEIRNIPHDEKEDVQNIVTNIYRNLGILQMEDNAKVRRGRKNGPIVIEYQDTKGKDILLKAVRKYNSDNKGKPLSTNIMGFPGASSRIYISEALAPMSKQILAAARELVKNGSYKYCWASKGNILLRKQEGQPAIVIKSLRQIMDLASE